MTKIFGAQHQRFDGLVEMYATAQPAVGKFINPDSDILAAIKKASPQTTTIVRVYTGAPTVDDVAQHPDAYAYGRDYATRVYAAVQDPAHMDYLESENEPNDHYGDLTTFVARMDDFLIGFSERARVLGFRPLGPNFSTGYPECFIKGSDYQLWPNAWQGMVTGLRSLQAADGALGLHEYDSPDLFRLWSDTKQRGYLVGRHKAIYECLPADLQSLPLFITEFGIDWLTQGVSGGFWHNRDENADLFMINQALEAWRRIYSTTPQLRGIALFLWGATDPAFAEYDIRRTDGSIKAFTQFFGEQLPGAPVPQPPPPEVSMRTQLQIMNSAWRSMGVTHKADAPSAFETKALALGLGYPLGEEYRDTGADGVITAGQCFGPEGVALECKQGDWGNISPFAIMTGLPWTPAPPPIPLPPGSNVNPPLPYAFPQALTNIGARGREGVAVPGLPFYRLSGATVRRGVSAFCKVTVFSKRGVPAIGVTVTNTFPDGNGEFIETDGDGNASFQFAASSAFSSPGSGPFTVQLAESAVKDNDSVPKKLTLTNPFSDVAYSLGDYQGTHTEISLQFIEQ